MWDVAVVQSVVQQLLSCAAQLSLLKVELLVRPKKELTPLSLPKSIYHNIFDQGFEIQILLNAVRPQVKSLCTNQVPSRVKGDRLCLFLLR